jgi:hypothetical protein
MSLLIILGIIFDADPIELKQLMALVFLSTGKFIL